MRRCLIALSLTVVVALAAGCGSSSTSSPSSGASTYSSVAAAPASFQQTYPGGGTGQPVDGIQCLSTEGSAQHTHSALFVLFGGQSVPLPAGVGIVNQAQCLYWLHTHDSSGIVHIESPQIRTFVLGNFLAVWGAKVNATTLIDRPVAKVYAYVDGKPWTGDPNKIPLTPHATIVLSDAPVDAASMPQGDFSGL